MKFILTCGGTAGHINPALAVAGRLAELVPGSEFLFIGAEGKMEMDLVPRAGYQIKGLEITYISRNMTLKGIAYNAKTGWNVIKSVAGATRIIKTFKPDAVIGTGGYVCFPVLMAASVLRIPTLVHESNAVPGLTTKLLTRFVDKIMLGFRESINYYTDESKLVYTGTPVRGEFNAYTKEEAKRELGLDVNKPLVVSVWGSLGASYMNDIMTQMIPMIKGDEGFSLIHACGSMYYARVMQALDENAPDYASHSIEVKEYIYDMPRVMAAADLILGRAGASTLAELAYMGKPTIIVPSPNVTNNHQEKNARVLEAAGGAEVLLEGQFTAESLLKEVKALVENTARLERMSEAMKSLSQVDATDRICRIILETAEK